VRTPYTFDTNLSVLKVFSLESVRKGASIEIRLEASNATNHPPRQGQGGLKITF
jgi:hypothetical protein